MGNKKLNTSCGALAQIDYTCFAEFAVGTPVVFLWSYPLIYFFVHVGLTILRLQKIVSNNIVMAIVTRSAIGITLHDLNM